MKKYYIKKMCCLGFGVYRSEVIRACDDLDQAFELAYQFSCETGLNCFVDYSYK